MKEVTVPNVVIFTILLTGSVILNSSATVITDQLVAHYPFNGNADDESGNGHDGTVNGATLSVDRFGNANGAYSFDGINDSIVISDEAAFDFERTDAFSQSFWIKTDRTGSDRFIFSKLESPYVDRGFGTDLVDGRLRFYLINDHPSNEIRVDTDHFISDNQWHHIVVAYDGSSLAAGVSIYVDNSLVDKVVGVDRLTGSILNDVTPSIGYRKDQDYFKGIVDDLRIYDKELSSQEVDLLYAIPEPASLSLIGLFTGGIYFIRRFFLV